MKKHIIIVAGGKGLRMGGEIPKQFLLVKDTVVLIKTIEAFYENDRTFNIILVLPSEQQLYWKELCDMHNFRIPHRVADGGETRFHSVKNGLALVEGEGVVGVHDGVRPFVSSEVITTCFEMAEQTKAVVPVIDVFETIRELTDDGSHTVSRECYKLVQTPQVFSADVLKRAYAQPYRSSFTDDASVVEALGIPVSLVKGNRENIKITTPFDMKVANALMECSI